MGTLVCFHAHPDDEAITTGGSMARAHAEGHRVVLVVATNGDHGEVPDDLAPGESLVDRRRAETDASARVLGIDRVVWLGYGDSGMTGWEQNAHPTSFHQADVDEAAARLAAVLVDEAADLFTIYDWHGGYGHPDHVKVHDVGLRAAELASSDRTGLRVLEATYNRDEFLRMAARLIENGALEAPADEDEPLGPSDDGNPFGSSEAELTLEVDVAEFALQKRASIACHRSQVTDSSFFLDMSDEDFAVAFGREWFIEHGVAPGMRRGWLFD